MGFACGACWRVFSSLDARNQHMDALGHWSPAFGCHSCGRHFDSHGAAAQHMDAVNHWDENAEVYDEYYYHDSYDDGKGNGNGGLWCCEDCPERFRGEDELVAHEVATHLYCADCNRYFDSPKNINQHFRGRRHRDRDIICPFCQAGYTTADGLIHHLEGGSCPKAPLNRDKLYRFLRRKDPGGIVAKNLLCACSDFTATNQAYNPKTRKFDCYFCTQSFPTLLALNAHLGSPALEQKLYHCPNDTCGKQFRTLAGLTSHLQSESCKFIKYDNMQKKVYDLVDSTNKLRF